MSQPDGGLAGGHSWLQRLGRWLLADTGALLQAEIF